MWENQKGVLGCMRITIAGKENTITIIKKSMLYIQDPPTLIESPYLEVGGQRFLSL
jgi:hypothetical protein